jgi:DNA modification methylase
VLDPFAGSCTTLQAARFLGRDAIGLDLSYRYLSQEAKDRLQITDYEAWTEGQAIQAQESEGDHPWFDRLYSEDKGNH